jgi:L-histidine N-alpha-methyltransferase
MKYSDLNTIADKISISSLLEQQSRKDIINEIFAGLCASQKHISSRFFYDEKGSSLFESITRLNEYYPTRTEKYILKEVSSSLVTTNGTTEIVELGSGDCSKISILLDSLPAEMLSSVKYYPVDISETSIVKSADDLSFHFPEIQIHGIMADFLKHLDILPGKNNRLVCFFGSTIGNLTHDEAITFLSGIRKMMETGDSLLVGFDMAKEIDIIEAAYNDAHGITEAFNKNILAAINEIAETCFEPEWFSHLAFYNQKEMRVEMHLEALRDMEISSPNFPYTIHIREGETIHTENSHKFTLKLIQDMAVRSGLKIQNIFTDKKEWFSLVQFHAND